MQNKKNHKKPAIPHEVVEAEMVAKKMYTSLTSKNAPKATPRGYVTGACYVLKILIDQASEQGTDRSMLKQLVSNFINEI